MQRWMTVLLIILAGLASGCGFLQSAFEREVVSNASTPQPCIVTPADMEGPYYIPDAPSVTTLVREGMAGQKLIITGTVYAADCATPLAGAVIDAWQADDAGEYDFSEQYILRGKFTADESGRYTLETILPGQYEPRPLHIHLKISHPDAGTLTTQLYFEGYSNNQGIDPALIIPLVQDGDMLRGNFDIVLNG